MEPELIPQRDNRPDAELSAPARGTDPKSSASDMNASLAVAVTDPPRPVDHSEIDLDAPDHGHNGNGTHANGNTVNGNSVNGHAHATMNGTSPMGTNGNGRLTASLSVTGYPGVLERNGKNGSAPHGSFARLAYADGATIPSDFPVALGWLGGAEADPTSFYLRFGKRALDIAVAGVGIVLIAPVFALIAALVKIGSRGPVFYKSERLGRNGRPFTFYKFRSMYVGAHEDRHKVAHLNEKKDGPVFKISCDPRTTRIGRFLRQTSLDELPQLAHVLRGDMTLVGPRPPLPEEVAKYESWHRRRLEVKPGLTCLWQISGRSRLGFNEWMRLDLEYIKRQSFATDAKILLRTIPAVVSREGAY